MDRRFAAFVSIILALFVLACGSGGGATTVTPGAGAPVAAPTAVAAAAPGKIGDRIEQDGTALTVVKTEQKTELDQFQKAKEGNVYLLAEVLIENTGQDKAPYNPLYFKVKDSEGFEYPAALVVGGQTLQSGELSKGDKARGTVAFEVKTTAKDFTLEYKPLIIGGGDGIKVALK